MNVTRTIAEEVAKKMIQPIIDKIKEKEAEMQKMADEVVKKSLPEDVRVCFENYPSYFHTTTQVTLTNDVLQTRVRCSSFPHNGNSWYPFISCPNEISERIKSFEIDINRAESERDKTEASIITTLLSLRTFNRVKESFPDAYQYMKSYEEKTQTVLSIPVNDIMQTIKKFKNE